MKILAARLCAFLLVMVLLAVPGAPARAQQQLCSQVYMVQPGDTMYDISVLCRVPYLALLGINYEIRDPSTIYPGQIIRLEAEVPLDWFHQPVSGPAQDKGLQPGGAYIVRRGDSLARIAFLYDTTVYDLMQLNPEIDETQVIVPDQVLLMPPTARHEKGWVGVSALYASGGQAIEARVVDFTPYARVHFRLGIRDEFDDFDYQVIETKTDSLGQARVTLTLPFYAWEDEIWEVRVVNLDEGEESLILSPGIRILD